MYGFTICHEKPYVTTLIGDSIWHVEGSMKESRKAKKADDSVITVYAGGVAEIDIRKDNGSVLKVYHGK